MQALMLRSRSNTLLSVRRVTERNAGRLTAGVDGEVALTPKADRASLKSTLKSASTSATTAQEALASSC